MRPGTNFRPDRVKMCQTKKLLSYLLSRRQRRPKARTPSSLPLFCSGMKNSALSVGVESVSTKVCASCSVQSQTPGDFCPNCGKGYLRVSPWKRRRVRLTASVIAAVVLLGGCGVALAVSAAQNRDVVAAEATAKASREVERAAAAQLASKAKAAEEADDTERVVRVGVVGALERRITTDAQKRVIEGTLDGPILRTSCTPLGGGSTDDLTALTTTFSCIAISTDNADGTYSGHGISATMNWDDGSYTWHLGD